MASEKPERGHFDNETRKWFLRNLRAETTVQQCEKCGLYYKPMLGHKCRRKKDGK